MEARMLTTLFQRTFHKYSALPLLGAIANDFDDWLLAQGYAVNSRTHAIEMFPHIDKDLRRRGIEHVTRLTHSTLRLCWRVLIRRFAAKAGTVRVLERYLATRGLLNGDDKTAPRSEIDVLMTAYTDYLQQIRGCARETIVTMFGPPNIS